MSMAGITKNPGTLLPRTSFGVSERSKSLFSRTNQIPYTNEHPANIPDARLFLLHMKLPLVFLPAGPPFTISSAPGFRTDGFHRIFDLWLPTALKPGCLFQFFVDLVHACFRKACRLHIHDQRIHRTAFKVLSGSF